MDVAGGRGRAARGGRVRDVRGRSTGWGALPAGRVATVATLAALALAPGARAADGWLVRVAFESGGDELGTARFEGGLRDDEEEDIEAGGQLHLELGLRRGFLGPAFESDFTVGYKSHTASARNGSVGITRITLNALQYYLLTERVRLGGGLTYHLSPSFEVDIDGQSGSESDFDDALGYTVAADYRGGEAWELGLRATRIEYELSDGQTLSGTVDAASVGGYFTYRF